MDGRVYAESLAYDATKEGEIVEIAGVLWRTKEIIEQLVESAAQEEQKKIRAK